ncbi:MAG: response regulator transcription factor [Chloroflexi bacterium]|nr:response regulator transcription factor [Chloroflexota bacterium]MBI3762075.1 response regulator transcription factor [Chloroflexota bacterium]
MSQDRILLVDDEHDIVWALRHSLSDEGYEVFTASNGLDALRIARHHRPDLIILDIVMPGLNGLQVCHDLRRDPALAAVPILFLSVRNAIEDRIGGLDVGGDDYLIKPFDLRELKAHVKALLRRNRPTSAADLDSGGEGSLLVVGVLALDQLACHLRINGRTVQLTPVEFDLLRFLMTRPGEVLTAEQMLQQVWGYPPRTGDPSLVRWHIRNLRAKIEPDSARPTHIRTISHHGYLLQG